MYAFQDVPGKGKGLVAIEKISKGTRILSEEPIITIPHDGRDSERLQTSICRQVDALSEYQRQAFLSMHNIHAFSSVAEQYLGIIRTIALPIETDGIGAGIFLEACRINHACDNNAQKNWNENIRRYTIHALRDIDEGEEITIYYLSTHKNRKARHEALQAKFEFTCSCRLCSLPPAQSQESDKRLDDIFRLDSFIGRGGIEGILSSPSRTLRYVDQQVQLYNEQGPDDVGLPRALLDAAQIALANGDLARGRIFMERAVFGWRTALGEDSTEVIKHKALAQDPSKHELYGISMKWKTSVDEVPSGLEPGDFEGWLWKRDKVQRLGEPIDLRNRATFPGFVDLPGKNAVDLDFYQSSDMVTYRPRRHWCFLAEIMDFTTLLRLQMEISDIDGRKLPLFFYTDGRGSELSPAQVQKGYTVVILYAQRHAFMFDEPGIRHEDPRMIKIFPISLHNLLALNDQVQQFSTEFDGLRICHGCGKKATTLKRCGKCSFFWYCGRTCQIAGWNERGHKANCKLLKDPDLQGLFVLKWDEYDSHIRFPLHVVTNKVEETRGIATTHDKEVVEPASKPYAIKTIAGKGKGLVATTKIAKGTRLLSEVPIFRVPRNNSDFEDLERIVSKEVKCLNDDQQRSFFDLTNIHGKAHSQSLGIARTNVLPLGSNASSGGLFLEASRINHSCRHNAQNTWNENIKQLTIHTLRDIEAGQEITISYLASTSEYAERQRFLKEKFKFECKCELCSLPRTQRKRSDSRLKKLQAIDNSIGAFFWGDLEAEMALHLLHTMFGLFKEEGIWNASIARAYNDAYEIAIENEDESRARIFAERAYDAQRLIEGDDSPRTAKMKRAAEELSVQTPKGMNEAEFENWLWVLNGASVN